MATYADALKSGGDVVVADANNFGKDTLLVYTSAGTSGVLGLFRGHPRYLGVNVTTAFFCNGTCCFGALKGFMVYGVGFLVRL
jgi:hypothetical protein